MPMDVEPKTLFCKTCGYEIVIVNLEFMCSNENCTNLQIPYLEDIARSLDVKGLFLEECKGSVKIGLK